MAAFRILNQFPVYHDSQGRLADGGSLRFYASGTTTPKDVYGDPGKLVNNGSSVTVGTDGRTLVDVWGDGAYRVRLYDHDNTLIAEADDVEVAGGTGQSIPALVTGHFLTNNGALLLWTPIREMPDPTGQDGKFPVASGDSYVLQSPPEPPVIPEPDIIVTESSFRGGTTSSSTKFLIQTGSGSAPSSGGRDTNSSVTFPVAFAKLQHVSVTQRHNGVTSNAAIPRQTNTAQSNTGFSVRFSTDDNSTWAGWNITSQVPFDWMAIGTVLVADE